MTWSGRYRNRWERHFSHRPAQPKRRRQKADRRVNKVTAPVLVVHGENDAVVPIAFGERLYGLIQSPKRFVRVAGAGHSDLGVAAARRFIAEQGLLRHPHA